MKVSDTQNCFAKELLLLHLKMAENKDFSKKYTFVQYLQTTSSLDAMGETLNGISLRWPIDEEADHTIETVSIS